MRRVGLRSFREVDPEAAWRLVSDNPRAVLVQADEPSPGTRPEPGALTLAAAKPLPDAVIQAESVVVVLAYERRAGRRLGARLARAGVAQVVVVRGGIPAWRAAAPGGSRPHSTAPDDSDTLRTWARPET